MAAWCADNNLEHNICKTVEVVIDFCKYPPSRPPPLINGALKVVESFRFLGTTITRGDTLMSCHYASSPEDVLLQTALEDEHLFEGLHSILQSHHPVLTSSITVW